MHMLKFLFASLAVAGTFMPQHGLAGDLAAAAVEGAWVVSVGAQPRDRFLIVKGARTERDEVRVSTAVYGWIDGKGQEVGHWKAQVFGDTIKLSFMTPADSKVTVEFKSTETSASGDFLSKAGKKHDVRMTRLDDEEFAAMRSATASTKAQQSKTKYGATKNSQISLVYVGADNCPACAGYRALMENDGKGLKKSMPDVAQARIVHVQMGYYKAAVPESALPDDLKWLLQPNGAGKLPMRKRGTPFFVAVVDRRVIAQGHGGAALESLVAPAIKAATAERAAAN